MIYHWEATAALALVRDQQTSEPFTLTGEGLWVCLLSSGSCTAALGDAPGSLPALPPKPVEAGGLILSRSPLVVTPAGDCHLLCLLLTGTAPAQMLAGLPEVPFPARGETCPGAAELMGRLAGDEAGGSRSVSQMVFALLWSHLIRVFTAAVGVSPGRYLTSVRIQAAMKLLLHREYSLDVVASLCGFSGANYLCRVFKKETGQTPAQWRAAAARTAVADLSADERTREQAIFI